MPSGLREGHKSTGFLRKRECRWLLPWRGNGRAELGWRAGGGLWKVAAALLAAGRGSEF